jgi:hypothetical protein
VNEVCTCDTPGKEMTPCDDEMACEMRCEVCAIHRRLPPPNGPPVLGDLGSMLAHRGLQHEAHHARDDSYVPTACSEESAYLTAEACLRGYHDRQCMSTDVTPPYCQGLQNAIDQPDGCAIDMATPPAAATTYRRWR